MKNLLVWQKLALLGAVFLVPLIFVTGAMISSVQSLGMASGKKELLGVEYSRPLLTLLRDLQVHRGLAAAVATGGSVLSKDLEAAEARIVKDIEALNAVDARLHAALGLRDQWPMLAKRCQSLLVGAASGAGPGAREHTEVIGAVLGFLREVADRSELMLDPGLNSYYYMHLFTNQLPQHADQVAKGWALIASIPPGDRLPPAALAELHRTAVLITFLQDEAKAALSKATDGAGASDSHLHPPAAFSEAEPDPIAVALTTGSLPMDPAALAQVMTERLADDYDLADEVGGELTSIVRARLDGLERKIRYSLAGAVLGLLLVTLLGMKLMRDITRPLGSLAATARAIEANDLDARVTVALRQDEIGNLAKALQQMIVAQRISREKLVENNIAMLEANERLQVKTDEAQKLAVEADHANRAKRDFLAVMSHEIRTPMNGIIGMTELALNTELTDAQREYLEMAKGSAEVLLELLNDILDFSKIEAGRLELEHTPFELRDALGDTMQTLGVRASARKLELALQIRPDVPDALLGDPHRLRQIIVNLVGNALKFTERGEVTVLVEKAGGSDTKTELRFVVRDTGIGIPAEAKEKIFSAFSQADVSTTRRFGGTGLGLAITSQLVGMMGGELVVESEEGKGSVFSFVARFDVQAERPSHGHDVPELENLRVLAVDDNATNRLILRELFTSWHMEVVLAESAEEGLKALDEASRAGQPIALVVTDMMMPEVDGFGLVERMKATPDLRETRIIMLTSSNRPEDVARCRSLGVGAHLAKPIKQSILMDTIVDVLGSGQRRKRVVPTGGPVPLQRPLHILLAEDNAVNQRLAVVNLESWGHHVTVANDGAEAVEAFAREPFDVVLMDSQMPRMGGFEATAAIRKTEGPRRTPIIAMTANVMKGYREECLAAGMDGYVAKPVRRDELIAAMALAVPDLLLPEQHAPPRPSEKLAAEVASSPSPEEETGHRPFDSEALLESLAGDREMLREVVRLCVDVDAPRLLAQLRDGVERGDLQAVEHAAHGLRGLIGEFHAPGVYATAQQLEETARTGRKESVPGEGAALIGAFQKLAEALRKFAGN